MFSRYTVGAGFASVDIIRISCVWCYRGNHLCALYRPPSSSCMTLHGRRAQSGYSSLGVMLGHSSVRRGQSDGVVSTVLCQQCSFPGLRGVGALGAYGVFSLPKPPGPDCCRTAHRYLMNETSGVSQMRVRPLAVIVHADIWAGRQIRLSARSLRDLHTRLPWPRRTMARISITWLWMPLLPTGPASIRNMPPSTRRHSHVWCFPVSSEAPLLR